MKHAARSPFSATDIVVALDTCIFRDLSYSIPDWLQPFEKMAAQGVRFCFLDNVSAEIVYALQEQRMSFAQMQLAAERSAVFLDRKVPLLPGGFELRWIVGSDDVEPIERMSPFEHTNVLWTSLVKSKNIQELETPFLTGEPGREFEMSVVDVAVAGEMFDDARQEWIDSVKRHDEKEPGELAASRDKILRDTRAAIDQRSCLPPPLSVRIDLWVHYRAWIDEMRNRDPSERLNPESKKRRNDAIDVTMLRTLMLPALLCVEPKFARSLRLLPSFQAEWVYDAQSLAKAWADGCLVAPEWPHE